MSILEQARQNRANAEDAAAFRQQQQQQRHDTDVASAVEQRLAQKAEESRLLDLQDTARAYGLNPEWVSMVNSLTNKSDSFPLTNEDLGLIAPGRQPEALAREADALRSKGGGPLSFDDLGALSRSTSDDAFIDITPEPRGLADTFGGF